VRGIYRASLDSPHDKTRVAETWFSGIYSPPRGAHRGRLLWATEEGALISQAFDAVTGRISGEPALVPGVGLPTRTTYDRGTPLSIGSDGTLIYGTSDPRSQLTWYSREGKVTGTIGEPAVYIGASLRISPDGKRVAVSRTLDKPNVWVVDLVSGELTRVSVEGGEAGVTWSPDGRQIAYTTGGIFTGRRAAIHASDFTGTGAPVRLTDTPHSQSNPDWSPDGKSILFHQTNSQGNFDLWVVSTSEEHKTTLFRETAAQESAPRFSPDGKWIAYVSDQSGRQQIYVESFPPSRTQQQASVDGGNAPVWRRDGNEVFYRSPDGVLMGVPIHSVDGRLQLGTPTALFPVGRSAYDVSLDGRQFLLLSPVREPEGSPLTVILNWQGRLPVRP
jgi:dipeptidyl aminopeptidase/acylaminoacyl peptidase